MHAVHRITFLSFVGAAALGAGTVQAQAPAPSTARDASCQASSSPTPPTVLELYTSEGCSSCPPADRWLSGFKGRKDVLALAFHVTYWDRLGWPDRFALPEGTARQHQLAQLAGSRQVYTPQVVAQGQDWPQWQRSPSTGPLAAAAGTMAYTPAVTLKLRREGAQVMADVSPATNPTNTPAGVKLAGYWAVLEDQHESKVRAGENAGETLRHDHVVRLYQPVQAWAAGAGTSSRLAASPGVPQHPRRVVFVVTDAATQRPVQAVALAC